MSVCCVDEQADRPLVDLGSAPSAPPWQEDVAAALRPGVAAVAVPAAVPIAVQIASDGLLNGPVGALVKVTPGGSTHPVVAGGLFAPYGVAIRDCTAYVTTGSVAVGGGQVVKIAI